MNPEPTNNLPTQNGPEKCPACWGKGRISTWDIGRVKIMRCKMCEGTGMLNAEREAPANRGEFRVNWQFPVGACVGRLIISGPGTRPTAEDIRAVIQFCEIVKAQFVRVEEPEWQAEQKRLFGGAEPNEARPN